MIISSEHIMFKSVLPKLNAIIIKEIGFISSDR